jgi:hypothetical protein
MLGSFAAGKVYSFSLPKILSIPILAVLVLLSVKITEPFRDSRYFSMGLHEFKTGNYAEAEELFKKSSLSGIGFALVEIRKGNLRKAADYIYRSFPQLKGGPSFKAYTEGMDLLEKRLNREARMKFIQAIRYRLVQFGLNPFLTIEMQNRDAKDAL